MMEYAVGDNVMHRLQVLARGIGPGHGLLDPAGDIVVAAAASELGDH